jgi:hypothetical protein
LIVTYLALSTLKLEKHINLLPTKKRENEMRFHMLACILNFTHALEQVSFAVMAVDISTAIQLSKLLSDTKFISDLAGQNFPGVTVTSKPAVFDKNNSPVTVASSGPCLMPNPALVVIVFFAAATVREVLY